ncbi:MAG: DNA polymerase I [Candidatus Omnitrophica bacterium CG11_big_fil_rev_8_21_14_0_20_63_9]|nr:MAG: DNA polymerase I [Candidatus Omnitrophica bacterium CG11_big_fil_rev_8_21_14_0_20_63_9]
MELPRAFLIDGTAFCYRAYYAIRSLSTSDGRPTNAVYGFAVMLQALQQKERPDYLAVAFDVGKPTFRHKKFEDYKVQRKPMPDPLIAQIPVVKQLLQASRVPVFEREGFEAEDVLASLAKRLVAQGIEVFLVTGDKDALQLVNSHIQVYNPHKDNVVLDAEAVRARYGVGPDQMVDLMALMGDEIDNIPGVPGIGEKTATHLIQQFGTLEGLYSHLEDVTPPARRANLQAAREQVALARELARIDADVAVDMQPDDLKVREPDWRALRSLFRELEFKRLLQNIESHTAAEDSSRAAVSAHVVRDAHGLGALCEQLTAHKAPVAVACWPFGEGEAAVLMALALEPSAAWVVRLDEACISSQDGQRLQRWCEDPHAAKVGHDLKTAMRWLRPLGIALQGIVGDSMLAAYLLNPARTGQPLSDLADERLGHPLPPLPSPGAAEGSLVDEAQPFAQAVCAALQLEAALRRALEETGQTPLYTQLEIPLLSVLERMEAHGVALDRPYLAGLQATMQTQLAQLTAEIFQLAGGEFNVNSPKQLAQVLFERLQLPIIKRTKTGASTDSDVLQQLAGRHPLPQKLIQYRELAKLVSTYVEALPKLADPRTGRIHTTLNQAATATGRLSSSEPNLQNIPIKTELGRSIRKAFVPGIPNAVLVAADYSQIELRILAHLSHDEQLTQAFREGRDIHRFTASMIYGTPEGDVQPEQRNAMKAVNFGILYGMTSHGLSKELGMSFEEAQAFIDAYFQRYPRVRSYLDQQIKQARRDGFVQTLLGRRRYIPEVNSPDGMIRQFGERMAINAPIQGTAADLIKRAMVQLDGALQREGMKSRMVLQVHDELIFEVPKAELAALAALVRRTMEGAIALDVPLTVTVKAGPNWLEMAPVG